MLITRIELQNVKSYCDDAVIFTEGTNAICGENGAGKSTLLEAIGFTLFNYLPYTQADFVREGEKTASIAVCFVSDQDGREYQVVRRCGSSADYYVYDAELDAKLVSGSGDVVEWLSEHLGLDSGADLAALFRDAVGVPQGLLTAPFLQTAAQRKPLFDRLLRVDEYERAWKALRETLRNLESKLAEHRETIASLEAQVERLPGLRQRAKTFSAEIAQIEARLADLRSDLSEASARREALEATKTELDGLTQKVEMLSTRLDGVAEQLAVTDKAVVEAQRAQATVEASQSGYDAYEAAQAVLSGLEADRAQRDNLRADWNLQEKSLALARERVKGLEADLLEVAGAEEQIRALEPQIELQGGLESALKVAQEQIRSLEVTKAQAAERQGRVDDLELRLEALEAGLVEAGQVADALHQARTQLEEARRDLTGLKAQQAAVRIEVERLAEQTQTLETTDTANCPVCEQPLTPEHRADLLTRNQLQLEELNNQDLSLGEKATTTTGTCSGLERRVQDFEVQLHKLPRTVDKDDLVAQIARVDGELAAMQAEITRLPESRAEAARLERELADLGDARGQCDRLAERAGRRVDVEERLGAERHAVGALEASLAEIEQTLTPFAELDRRLADGRVALNRHEEDHRRYLEHAKIAADLPERREQADRLRAQEAELSAERDETHTQVRKLAVRFDPDAFAAARQREAEFRAEQAGLEGVLGKLRQQEAETKHEIDGLEAAKRAMAAEQAAKARKVQLLALAGFIREVIRQAGPHVTRRLLQQVSLEAARLFSDVMADYAARLRWDENYEIVLEKNGRDRRFQQLSGGEQMAAALATRLALLRELSAIDVAFFDEPTSNLDDARRDSLAEQILAVKGFSQLFVISHDDTFERVTHNIVRVRKDDGVSRVELQ